MPQSWAVQHWPPDIYPGTPARGKYIVRQHRDELLAVGALVRIGRDLVVLGGPYVAWLAEQTDRVTDFQIAPNIVRAVMPRAREDAA